MIELKDGKYAVYVQAMKKAKDEPSAMAPYLGEVVMVTKAEGQIFITFMLKEQQVITGFQIAEGTGELLQSIDQNVNEELNSRYEMFQLTKLTTTITARVQYELTYEGQQINGDEELRLVVNKESLQNVEDMA